VFLLASRCHECDLDLVLEWHVERVEELEVLLLGVDAGLLHGTSQVGRTGSTLGPAQRHTKHKRT
jgi:hypothetical protein